MYNLFRPILFQWDAEKAHRFVLSSLARMPSLGRLMTRSVPEIESLSQTLWGLTFPHPIGLAAGLDKNAEAVDGFFSIGSAFVEVGTVTPRPQPGNPSPRLFRLIDDQALVNRMGFNNEGAEAMLKRLNSRKSTGIVGINLGKNKVTENDNAISDYTMLVRKLAPVADYFVINVSSPNTPGLRDLQSAEQLLPLVRAVQAERDSQYEILHHNGRKRPPVLVKLAPDLANESLSELAQRLCDSRIDGIIATNTTIRREGLRSPHHSESGGLSGKPLKARSTEVIRLVRKSTNGQIPIIASGGVFDAADAYEKILAGASLVQVYTALIYEGPKVFFEIVAGLEKRMHEDGFHSITEAVGAESTSSR